MSFTDAEERKLINLVTLNSVIYDANHDDYLNTAVKDNIWKEIGRELNKNHEDCKKKWKFIRDGYTRFKKRTKVGTSWASIKLSKHKRHKQLAFLDNCLHQRGPNKSTLSSAPFEFEHNFQNENGDIETEVKKEIQSCSDDAAEDIKTDVEEVEEMVKNDLPKKRINPRRVKVLKRLKHNDDKRQLFKNVEKVDDIDLFCRHMGQVLRNLPPYERAKAKKHLGEVLSDYEISAAAASNSSDVFV